MLRYLPQPRELPVAVTVFATCAASLRQYLAARIVVMFVTCVTMLKRSCRKDATTGTKATRLARPIFDAVHVTPHGVAENAQTIAPVR